MHFLPQGVSLALRLVTKELEQLRKKKLIIALDGHSSSGKSTLAKDLSKLLEIPHIDSGAMYRAVTLYLLQNNIDVHNKDNVVEALKDIRISFKLVDKKSRTFLNGESVENEIRTMAVSEAVSYVSAFAEVRIFLVQQQREMGNQNGVIMDGRDIGTIVFPDADVKLFITANTEIRADRRYDELCQRGVDITKTEVKDNLVKRDHIDSTRKESPLLKANDAILLDTSQLDRGEMLASAIKMIFEKIKTTQ